MSSDKTTPTWTAWKSWTSSAQQLGNQLYENLSKQDVRFPTQLSPSEAARESAQWARYEKARTQNQQSESIEPSQQKQSPAPQSQQHQSQQSQQSQPSQAGTGSIASIMPNISNIPSISSISLFKSGNNENGSTKSSKGCKTVTSRSMSNLGPTNNSNNEMVDYKVKYEQLKQKYRALSMTTMNSTYQQHDYASEQLTRLKQEIKKKDDIISSLQKQISKDDEMMKQVQNELLTQFNKWNEKNEHFETKVNIFCKHFSNKMHSISMKINKTQDNDEMKIAHSNMSIDYESDQKTIGENETINLLNEFQECKECKLLKNKCNELTQENENLQHEIKNLTKSIAVEAQEFESKLKEKEKEFVILRDTIGSLTEKLGNSSIIVNDEKKKRLSMENVLQRKLDEINDSKKQLSDLSNENSVLRQELTKNKIEFTAKQDSLTLEIDTLTQELNEGNDKLSEMENSLNQECDTSEHLRRQISDLNDKLNKLKKKFDKLKKEKQKMSKTNECQSNELNDLKEMNEKLLNENNELTEYQENHKDAIAKYDEMNDIIDSNKEEIHQLKLTLQNKNLEFETLEKENQSLIKKSRLNSKNLSRLTNLAANLDSKFQKCEKMFLEAQKDLNLPVQLVDDLELNFSDSNSSERNNKNKKRKNNNENDKESLLDEMINEEGIVSVNKVDFEIMKENAKINEQLKKDALKRERKEREKAQLIEYFQKDSKEMITTLGTSNIVNMDNDIMYFDDSSLSSSSGKEMTPNAENGDESDIVIENKENKQDNQDTKDAKGTKDTSDNKDDNKKEDDENGDNNDNNDNNKGNNDGNEGNECNQDNENNENEKEKEKSVKSEAKKKIEKKRRKLKRLQEKKRRLARKKLRKLRKEQVSNPIFDFTDSDEETQAKEKRIKANIIVDTIDISSSNDDSIDSDSSSSDSSKSGSNSMNEAEKHLWKEYSAKDDRTLNVAARVQIQIGVLIEHIDKLKHEISQLKSQIKILEYENKEQENMIRHFGIKKPKIVKEYSMNKAKHDQIVSLPSVRGMQTRRFKNANIQQNQLIKKSHNINSNNNRNLTPGANDDNLSVASYGSHNSVQSARSARSARSVRSMDINGGRSIPNALYNTSNNSNMSNNREIMEKEKEMERRNEMYLQKQRQRQLQSRQQRETKQESQNDSVQPKKRSFLSFGRKK